MSLRRKLLRRAARFCLALSLEVTAACTLGSAAPGASTFGFVTTRGHLGTSTAAVTTPYMARKFVVNRSGGALSALQLGFVNRAIVNPSGEVATAGTYTCLAATIEYNGSIVGTATFSGSGSGSTTGDFLWSDYFTLSTPVPNGAMFYIRYRVQNSVAMPVCTSGNGDYEYTAGGDATISNGADLTAGGTVTSDGTGTIIPIPIILGVTQKPNWLIIGDSEQAGIKDTADASGDIGEFARAIGARYAYFKVSDPGERASQFVTQSAMRKILGQLASHIFCGLGVNDNLAGDSAATMLANHATIRGFFPRKPFYGSTLTPITTGAWTLPDGSDQTLNANNAAWQSFNTSMRAVPSGYAGIFDPAAVCENGSSGKWNAPGYTNDGLHGLRAANLLMTFTATVPATVAWHPLNSSPALYLEGDTNVTTASGNVTTWTDQSPAAIACTASGALRPTLSTSINGKQCLSFNGTQALQVPSFTFLGDKTIEFIFKLNATPGASSFVVPLAFKDTGGTFSAFDFMNLASYQNVSFLYDWSGAGTTAAGYNPTLNTNAHHYIISKKGGAFAAKQDGATQTVTTSSTLAKTATDVGSIGGALSNALALSNAANCDFAMIGVWPRILSPLEQFANAAYVTAKWGVS